MRNKSVVKHLQFIADLLTLHAENPFRIKAFEKAAQAVAFSPVRLYEGTSAEQLMTIEGIGQSIAQVIAEYIQTSDSAFARQCQQNLSPQLLETLQRVRGLGAKKLLLLRQQLQVESLEDLLAVCESGQICECKGFGAKMAAKLLDATKFALSARGKIILPNAVGLATQLTERLRSIFPDVRTEVAGQIRRQLPICDTVTLITEALPTEMESFLHREQFQNIQRITNTVWGIHSVLRCRCQFVCTVPQEFGTQLFQHSASSDFLSSWREQFPIPSATDEQSIFSEAGLSVIPAFLRESFPPSVPLDSPVIQTEHIRGIIHAHSDWSDGQDTVEQMATYCRDAGYEYLVLSDHSRSSFQANGLDEHRFTQQHELIDSLNRRFAPFRILKSVECDILEDGSLDFSPAFLRIFDLVIAAVHRDLDMSQDRATKRIVRALSHREVDFLAHPSGRILLKRPGYGLDYTQIFDLCRERGIAVEINANPHRADLDYTYIRQAIDSGVYVSIHPDAHSCEDIQAVHWGVLNAQKAMVSPAHNVSSLSLEQLMEWKKAKQKKW